MSITAMQPLGWDSPDKKINQEVQADIMNKLGPISNLIQIIEAEDLLANIRPDLYQLVLSEFEKSKKSIKELSNYPIK